MLCGLSSGILYEKMLDCCWYGCVVVVDDDDDVSLYVSCACVSSFTLGYVRPEWTSLLWGSWYQGQATRVRFVRCLMRTRSTGLLYFSTGCVWNKKKVLAPLLWRAVTGVSTGIPECNRIRRRTREICFWGGRHLPRTLWVQTSCVLAWASRQCPCHLHL